MRFLDFLIDHQNLSLWAQQWYISNPFQSFQERLQPLFDLGRGLLKWELTGPILELHEE